jgi:Zn finger protein HypA/HybF involved in hydrogenase expression
VTAKRTYECLECGNVWRVPHGHPRPACCPECESKDMRIAPEDRSQGRDHERGHGRAGKDDTPWETDS